MGICDSLSWCWGFNYNDGSSSSEEGCWMLRDCTDNLVAANSWVQLYTRGTAEGRAHTQKARCGHSPLTLQAPRRRLVKDGLSFS